MDLVTFLIFCMSCLGLMFSGIMELAPQKDGPRIQRLLLSSIGWLLVAVLLKMGVATPFFPS